MNVTGSWRLRLDGLRLLEGVEGVVGRRPRHVRHLVELSLLLPDVPVEALGQGGEPVGDLIGRADGRHRVDRGRHVQAEKQNGRLWLKRATAL